MVQAFRESWALFVGMLFLMVSNGLLATLLTLTARDNGFGDTTIGLVQSAYPLGAFLGCLLAPRLVVRIGHVRTFATFAALASSVALFHIMTADPWVWAALRAQGGFCFAGLYVVAESWLNGRAGNRNRGSLLSIYFVIQTGGAAAGQMLLSLPVSGPEMLFLLVSLMVSLAMVPVLTSVQATPAFELPERLSLRELFRLSPMGLTGSFLNGAAQGSLFIGLALYGGAIGLAAGKVGLLVGSCTLGGMALQVPLGRLSDRFDRRLVILAMALLSIPVCIFLGVSGAQVTTGWVLFLAVGTAGGLVLPLYSLCVAHTNDYLRPGQVVAASASLVLILNGGIVIGPTLAALSLEALGPGGLFWLVAAVQGILVGLAAYRLTAGRDRPEEPGRALALTHTATPVAARLGSEVPAVAEEPPGP